MRPHHRYRSDAAHGQHRGPAVGRQPPTERRLLISDRVLRHRPRRCERWQWWRRTEQWRWTEQRRGELCFGSSEGAGARVKLGQPSRQVSHFFRSRQMSMNELMRQFLPQRFPMRYRHIILRCAPYVIMCPTHGIMCLTHGPVRLVHVITCLTHVIMFIAWSTGLPVHRAWQLLRAAACHCGRVVLPLAAAVRAAGATGAAAAALQRASTQTSASMGAAGVAATAAEVEAAAGVLETTAKGSPKLRCHWLGIEVRAPPLRPGPWRRRLIPSLPSLLPDRYRRRRMRLLQPPLLSTCTWCSQRACPPDQSLGSQCPSCCSVTCRSGAGS